MPRRPWWRWWAVALMSLAFIHAASPGPALYAVARRWLSHEGYSRLYRPTASLIARLAGPRHVRYLRWCEYAGFRHDGYEVEEIVPGVVSLHRRDPSNL